MKLLWNIAKTILIVSRISYSLQKPVTYRTYRSVFPNVELHLQDFSTELFYVSLEIFKISKYNLLNSR